MTKTLIFLAFAIIGLSSCTKSSSSSSSSNTGTMSATVSGAAFSSANCYLTSGSGYEILGQSGSSSITFAINGALANGALATGTYNLDSTGVTNTATYTLNGTTVKKSKTGTLTITAVNTGVSVIGTFNFTCTDGTTVTSGTFTAVI